MSVLRYCSNTTRVGLITRLAVTQHRSYSVVLPLYASVPLSVFTTAYMVDASWIQCRHDDHRSTSHTIPCLYFYETTLIAESRRYGLHVSRYEAHIS